jgi:hypothetical protein
MPNTGEPQGQEPTTDPVEPAATQPTGTEPPKEKDPWEGLPEEWAWTKTAVQSANREAASRRTALREAEDKLKDAKSPEEVQAAIAEYKRKGEELETTIARERAARKHKLSDDVLEFLTGKTEAEIEKQAEKLAALKPASQDTKPPRVVTVPAPTGGVTPTNAPPSEDGKAAWKAYKGRR